MPPPTPPPPPAAPPPARKVTFLKKVKREVDEHVTTGVTVKSEFDDDVNTAYVGDGNVKAEHSTVDTPVKTEDETDDDGTVPWLPQTFGLVQLPPRPTQATC